MIVVVVDLFRSLVLVAVPLTPLGDCYRASLCVILYWLFSYGGSCATGLIARERERGVASGEGAPLGCSCSLLRESVWRHSHMGKERAVNKQQQQQRRQQRPQRRRRRRLAMGRAEEEKRDKDEHDDEGCCDGQSRIQLCACVSRGWRAERER